MKQLSRKEINEKDKWDLTPIFKTVKDWEDEYNKVLKDIDTYEKYKGKITASKEMFKEFLTFDESLDRRLYKVYYYAHLNFDSDTTDNEYQVLKGKTDELLQKYSVATAFITPEILKADYGTIKSYIDSDSDLTKYSYSFENMFRIKGHELSDEQQLVIASLSNVNVS